VCVQDVPTNGRNATNRVFRLSCSACNSVDGPLLTAAIPQVRPESISSQLRASTGVGDSIACIGAQSRTIEVKESTGVTRSTSPISSHVVSSILKEDAIINDDDYTVHFNSKVFQNQNSDAGVEVHNEDYYTKVLRHRLRKILVNHNERDISDCDSDSGKSSASNGNNVEGRLREGSYADGDLDPSKEALGDFYRAGYHRTRKNTSYKVHQGIHKHDSYVQNDYVNRKYYRSRADSPCRTHHRFRQTERGATEELMSSMAQIMSAVGAIVTQKQKHYRLPKSSFSRGFDRQPSVTAKELIPEPWDPDGQKSRVSSTKIVPITETVPSKSGMLNNIMSKLQASCQYYFHHNV
jgi:hypothetical protein